MSTDEKRPAAEIASAIAEGVRALNHATLPPAAPGLDYPGDAYAVLGSLGEAAARLPQALEQIDRFLTGLLDSARLTVNDGDYDPAGRIAVASEALDDAKAAALQLRELLGEAQTAINALGYRDDQEDAR